MAYAKGSIFDIMVNIGKDYIRKELGLDKPQFALTKSQVEESSAPHHVHAGIPYVLEHILTVNNPKVDVKVWWCDVCEDAVLTA